MSTTINFPSSHPQSANCVFVEAIQTLQDCRQLKGVIGGTILYHNK